MSAELPGPLVPAEVDLRDFSFMPLDVRRLRDSDLSLVATGDEFKAAVLLWCAAWHQVPAASLPKDERWLARHSGAGQAWPQVRAEALRGFVLCTDDRLYHRVLSEKALESWDKKLAQRARTKAATEARMRQRDRDDVRDGHRDGARNVHQGKLREGKGREGKGEVNQERMRPRKAPLPPNFEISPRIAAWATEKGFDRLPDHLDAFKRKCLAKGYQYVDWDSAFMEAVREDWAGIRRQNGAGAGHQAPGANKQESLEQRNAAVADRWQPPADE